MTRAKKNGALSIEAKVLRAALKDVAGVVEARSTIPILSNLLLTATPTALTITGTDMDVWGERHVTLSGGEAMAVTVESAVIGRIADKLPADGIAQLMAADGKLTVTCGRSRFTLGTLPTEDFPKLPTDDWTAEFEIPAITLAAALHQVAFAISTEEVRYYLNGVFIHAPESGDLRFATTDGHRLARASIARPDGAETLPDIIVPRKVVKVVAALLDRHDGNVDVRVTDKRIRFEIGETTVQAKLIDGTFPDYTRVVPSSHQTIVKADRDTLIAAIARVTTISSDKTRTVKVAIDRDVMTLSVSSPENGTATEELPCDHSGPALTIGFNARYWLDMLNHLSADEVEGTFTESASPSLWRDREDSPLIYVLMPMRV